MQLVEERAPNGFAHIGDVLSVEELENVAAGYKRIAGFDKDALNSRPPILTAVTNVIPAQAETQG